MKYNVYRHGTSVCVRFEIYQCSDYLVFDHEFESDEVAECVSQYIAKISGCKLERYEEKPIDE